MTSPTRPAPGAGGATGGSGKRKDDEMKRKSVGGPYPPNWKEIATEAKKVRR